jgi:hypothetical protein
MSLTLALNRVKSKCAKGRTVKLYVPSSDNGYEEDFSAIVTVKAFPVRYSPFNRKIQETVDWHMEVDVLAYVPYGVIADESYNVDLYTLMEVDNRRYNVYKMQPYSQYDNTYLYWIIGGRRN